MITTNNAVKRFGQVTALDGIGSTVPDGCIYGLVGSNGAGKSTFLRLLAGVYRPDGGTVRMDDAPIYDNPAVKPRIAMVPDELYFLPGANIRRMADLYAAAYPIFDRELLCSLCETFGLSMLKPLHTFSKGMRRQAAFVLALACRTEYLLLDETFDGLDPILRNLAKRLVYDAVCERGVTVVLTSHSLRELEDTCDQLALLHKGGLVVQSDVDSLKTTLCKVQIVFPQPYDRSRFDELSLDILRYTQHGSVANIILRGEHEALLSKLYAMEPLLCEALPLSLEEVFVHEMEALGYAFDAPLETPPGNGTGQKEATQ
jgi:ABC-2 type transport system ATP-binding protein